MRPEENILQDAHHGDLLCRPNQGRQERIVQAGRSSVLLAFKRVGWIGPIPRASREHIGLSTLCERERDRQATLSIFFSILLLRKRELGEPAFSIACFTNAPISNIRSTF